MAERAGEVPPEESPAVAEARSRVLGPAVGLMVTGGLGVLFGLWLLVQRLSGASRVVEEGLVNDDGKLEQYRLAFENAQLSGGVYIALVLFGSALVIYGALHMRGVRSYSLAVAASMVAMTPCLLGPCCCVGLPIGLWSMVVLVNPWVTAGFAESARGER